MVTYHYGPGTYNMTQLQNEITAVGGNLATGLVGINGSGASPGSLTVTAVDILYQNALSAKDKATLDTTVANHVARTILRPPVLGSSCYYCTKPADFTSGTFYPALVASVTPDQTQVNVGYLDSSGAWFKDGPIPFLQDGQSLPASKGFAFWPGWQPA